MDGLNRRYTEEEQQAFLRIDPWFYRELHVKKAMPEQCPGRLFVESDGRMRRCTISAPPEGNWYDLHTGLKYSGGRMMDLYRTLDSIPVLVKEGSILPFTDEISGVQTVKNPNSLRIKVFAGKEGNFSLYEDDNETCRYQEGIALSQR